MPVLPLGRNRGSDQEITRAQRKEGQIFRFSLSNTDITRKESGESEPDVLTCRDTKPTQTLSGIVICRVVCDMEKNRVEGFIISQ